MLNLIWNFSFFIITLGILVTIHELGHFLVARFYNIGILKFSIGFGKILWSRKDRYGTKFSIGIIPLGGYVKILEKDDKNSKIIIKKKIFSEQSIFKRSLIIFSGSFANFLLAVFLYCVIYVHGLDNVRPIVSNVITNSVADQLNIIPGMIIKSVDGVNTPDWNSVRMIFLHNINNKSLDLCVSKSYDTNCIIKHISLNKLNFDYHYDPFLYLGIVEPNFNFSNIISYIESGSIAELFKLRIGDILYEVNNVRITGLIDFINQIICNKNSSIKLVIIRDNIKHIFRLPFKLIKNNKFKNFLGIYTEKNVLSNDYKIVDKYNIFFSIKKSILNTIYIIRLTINLLLKTIFGEFKVSNLSGPIFIAKSSGVSARYGIIYYLRFLALISINIGVINLFPIPILDGGYLLFLLIEKLKGKPLSEKFHFYSYRIGSILLIILMIIALFNDLSHF
ncbi:RIP metalloprotease RseP [Candidatus Purcelliella pentastirinorum]|uniref:RIP metalloprotease RseP n=1 Tax=Candidatus Purcelliella pentastirinorum TaxID=472834 RepID=UPI002367AAA2|nr:RIP metalloprotease RseP [Candidatus Purcelliella pentastirinorum]WDI79013.1 RIP metalloprotease RseP [Candidatus Purcelliella pentastirinorum]WDR80150.1 RIP metalloprotease RseP [Candidatus Purcelliella pentastirinorum]